VKKEVEEEHWMEEVNRHSYKVSQKKDEVDQMEVHLEDKKDDALEVSIPLKKVVVLVAAAAVAAAAVVGIQ
jgi:hypothetical protein